MLGTGNPANYLGLVGTWISEENLLPSLYQTSIISYYILKHTAIPKKTVDLIPPLRNFSLEHIESTTDNNICSKYREQLWKFQSLWIFQEYDSYIHLSLGEPLRRWDIKTLKTTELSSVFCKFISQKFQRNYIHNITTIPIPVDMLTWKREITRESPLDEDKQTTDHGVESQQKVNLPHNRVL